MTKAMTAMLVHITKEVHKNSFVGVHQHGAPITSPTSFVLDNRDIYLQVFHVNGKPQTAISGKAFGV